MLESLLYIIELLGRKEAITGEEYGLTRDYQSEDVF